MGTLLSYFDGLLNMTAGSSSKAEYFGSETYLDGLCRAVETAGTAVPALVRIFDRWKLFLLVEMDHI
jgi:hypothetical protein